MALTIELPENMETTLAEIAEVLGETPTDYALQVLFTHIAPIAELLQRTGRLNRNNFREIIVAHENGKQLSLFQGPAPTGEEKSLAAIQEGFGMFAGRGRTVNDFLTDRHAEAEQEIEQTELRRNLREHTEETR